MRHQRRRDRGGEAVPVELRAEAPVGPPVDQLRGNAALVGQCQAGAGPVREDDADRETGLEHRLEDRPGTRDKDREAHTANLVGSPRASEDQPRVQAGPQGAAAAGETVSGHGAGTSHG